MMLTARADQHHVIEGGSASPTLDDVSTLRAPYGVSLPATLIMTWGVQKKRIRVFLVTLSLQDHPTTLSLRDVNAELLERDTELEDYNPYDQRLKSLLSDLITLWVQIRISDLFARKWYRGGGGG